MTDVGRRRVLAHVGAMGFAGLVLALRLHPHSAWYPGCPVYLLFHVRCPGCGATRAVAALLQGHLGEALRCNGMFVAALPFLMGYAGLVYRRMLGRAEFRWPESNPAATFAYIAAVVSFAVLRNVFQF